MSATVLAALLARYRKAALALLLATATWGATAALDDRITAAEWFGLLGVLSTAAGVAAVRNAPESTADRPPVPGI